MLVPDSELFQTNVRSTYNVIEAASKLGVKKIIIASSETVYGVCFAQGNQEYDHFPLDEEDDVNPEDTYVFPSLFPPPSPKFKLFQGRYISLIQKTIIATP